MKGFVHHYKMAMQEMEHLKAVNMLKSKIESLKEEIRRKDEVLAFLQGRMMAKNVQVQTLLKKKMLHEALSKNTKEVPLSDGSGERDYSISRLRQSLLENKKESMKEDMMIQVVESCISIQQMCMFAKETLDNVNRKDGDVIAPL
jgi:hypothetical protein